MSQDFDCFSAEDFKEGLGPLGKLDDTMMRYKQKYKMVFFMLACHHWEILSLRRAFHFEIFSVWMSQKNWEDQDMKSGKADTVLKSWNKTDWGIYKCIHLHNKYANVYIGLHIYKYIHLTEGRKRTYFKTSVKMSIFCDQRKRRKLPLM